MEKKTEKMFFVFKIIVFELGTANSHTPEQDIYNPQSMRVNKHPYDFKLLSGRYFTNDFASELWKNMIKAL